MVKQKKVLAVSDSWSETDTQVVKENISQECGSLSVTDDKRARAKNMSQISDSWSVTDEVNEEENLSELPETFSLVDEVIEETDFCKLPETLCIVDEVTEEENTNKVTYIRYLDQKDTHANLHFLIKHSHLLQKRLTSPKILGKNAFIIYNGEYICSVCHYLSGEPINFGKHIQSRTHILRCLEIADEEVYRKHVINTNISSSDLYKISTERDIFWPWSILQKKDWVSASKKVNKYFLNNYSKKNVKSDLNWYSKVNVLGNSSIYPIVQEIKNDGKLTTFCEPALNLDSLVNYFSQSIESSSKRTLWIVFCGMDSIFNIKTRMSKYKIRDLTLRSRFESILEASDSSIIAEETTNLILYINCLQKKIKTMLGKGSHIIILPLEPVILKMSLLDKLPDLSKTNIVYSDHSFEKLSFFYNRFVNKYSLTIDEDGKKKIKTFKCELFRIKNFIGKDYNMCANIEAYKKSISLLWKENISTLDLDSENHDDHSSTTQKSSADFRNERRSAQKPSTDCRNEHSSAQKLSTDCLDECSSKQKPLTDSHDNNSSTPKLSSKIPAVPSLQTKNIALKKLINTNDEKDSDHDDRKTSSKKFVKKTEITEVKKLRFVSKITENFGEVDIDHIIIVGPKSLKFVLPNDSKYHFLNEKFPYKLFETIDLIKKLSREKKSILVVLTADVTVLGNTEIFNECHECETKLNISKIAQNSLYVNEKKYFDNFSVSFVKLVKLRPRVSVLVMPFFPVVMITEKNHTLYHELLNSSWKIVPARVIFNVLMKTLISVNYGMIKKWAPFLKFEKMPIPVSHTVEICDENIDLWLSMLYKGMKYFEANIIRFKENRNYLVSSSNVESFSALRNVDSERKIAQRISQTDNFEDDILENFVSRKRIKMSSSPSSDMCNRRSEAIRREYVEEKCWDNFSEYGKDDYIPSTFDENNSLSSVRKIRNKDSLIERKDSYSPPSDNRKSESLRRDYFEKSRDNFSQYGKDDYFPSTFPSLNDKKFDHAYLVLPIRMKGLIQFPSTIPITQIFHDYCDNYIPSYIRDRMLNPIIPNSVCFIMPDIIDLCEITSYEIYCNKIGCLQPLYVIDSSGDDLQMEIETNVIPKINNFIYFVDGMNKLIPSLPLPVASTSILCDVMFHHDEAHHLVAKYNVALSKIPKNSFLSYIKKLITQWHNFLQPFYKESDVEKYLSAIEIHIDILYKVNNITELNVNMESEEYYLNKIESRTIFRDIIVYIIQCGGLNLSIEMVKKLKCELKSDVQYDRRRKTNLENIYETREESDAMKNPMQKMNRITEERITTKHPMENISKGMDEFIPIKKSVEKNFKEEFVQMESPIRKDWKVNKHKPTAFALEEQKNVNNDIISSNCPPNFVNTSFPKKCSIKIWDFVNIPTDFLMRFVKEIEKDAESRICDNHAIIVEMSSEKNAKILESVLANRRLGFTKIKALCDDSVNIRLSNNDNIYAFELHFQDSFAAIKNTVFRNCTKSFLNSLEVNEEINVSLYKLSPCKSKTCADHRKCWNFHNAKDKRRNPYMVKYRPVNCPTGDANTCSRGIDCLFCHNEFELKYHPYLYQIQPCITHSRENCPISVCERYHKCNPWENFYTSFWKNCIVFGLQFTLKFLIGIVNSFHKKGSHEVHKTALIITTSTSYSDYLQHLVTFMLQPGQKFPSSCVISNKVPEGANIVFGTPKQFLQNVDSSILKDVSTLVIDDIEVIKEDMHHSSSVFILLKKLKEATNERFENIQFCIVAENISDQITEYTTNLINSDLYTFVPASSNVTMNISKISCKSNVEDSDSSKKGIKRKTESLQTTKDKISKMDDSSQSNKQSSRLQNPNLMSMTQKQSSLSFNSQQNLSNLMTRPQAQLSSILEATQMSNLQSMPQAQSSSILGPTQMLNLQSMPQAQLSSMLGPTQMSNLQFMSQAQSGSVLGPTQMSNLQSMSQAQSNSMLGPTQMSNLQSMPQAQSSSMLGPTRMSNLQTISQTQSSSMLGTTQMLSNLQNFPQIQRSSLPGSTQGLSNLLTGLPGQVSSLSNTSQNSSNFLPVAQAQTNSLSDYPSSHSNFHAMPQVQASTQSRFAQTQNLSTMPQATHQTPYNMSQPVIPCNMNVPPPSLSSSYSQYGSASNTIKRPFSNQYSTSDSILPNKPSLPGSIHPMHSLNIGQDKRLKKYVPSSKDSFPAPSIAASHGNQSKVRIKDVEKYIRMPILHSEYKTQYALFMAQDVRHRKNDKYSKLKWNMYWRKYLLDNGASEATEGSTLQRNVATLAPTVATSAPPVSDNFSHSSQLKSSKPQEDIAVDEVVVFLNNFSKNIKFLGTSLQNVILRVLDLGPDSEKAMAFLGSESSLKTLRDVADTIKNSDDIPVNLQKFCTVAHGKILKLLNKIESKKPTLPDVQNLARATVGKSTSVIIDTIKSSLVYYGHTNPSLEMVNKMFMDIKSIHFNMN